MVTMSDNFTVQKAAAVLSEALDMDDYPDCHRSMPGAEALAAAGLLAGPTPTLTPEQQAVIDAASRHHTRMESTVARECSEWIQTCDHEWMQTCDHEDECPTVGESPVCGGCFDDKVDRDGEIYDDSGVRPEDCPICAAVDRLVATTKEPA